MTRMSIATTKIIFVHHDKDDDEDMSIGVNPGIEYAYSRPATSLANPSRDQVIMIMMMLLFYADEQKN